jgi:predicted transcriptional regulator
MAKTPPLGVRLDPDVKAALEMAAEADDRPLSAMIAKIVAQWVRREGWLKQ